MPDTAVSERPATTAPRTDRINVLMTTEGTYPHILGGVGTWCDSLVTELDDVDFNVFALMMNPFIRESYTRPSNTALLGVPIWGVEEPAEFNPAVSTRRLITLSALMSERTARDRFVPILREMLEMIVGSSFEPKRFGELLYLMHKYFKTNDYRGSFRTRAVWEVFRDIALTDAGEDPSAEDWEDVDPETNPSPQEIFQRFNQLRGVKPIGDTAAREANHHVPRLHEATESMRVMYRLLTPLNYEIPDSDIVHATAAGFCTLPGIIKKIERGTPFLITEHGVFMREQMLFLGRIGFPYHLRKFFIQLVSAVARASYYYADQISPVCAYNARWEAANGATREQIHVIYNGGDTEKFKPRVVERPAEPTVVMLSRVDMLKDIETALKVAAEVRKEIPDVRFRLFGPEQDPAYASAMKKLHAELKLEGTFEFMGATSDAPGALNQGDLLLLSSMSEAFPYTVIEAMLCGIPVVSTNVGGVPEAVGDLGETARIRDVAGLARGVIRLLQIEEDERAELKRACRERAVELFSIVDAMQEYRDTYARLVAGERPAVRAVPSLAREPEAPPVPGPGVQPDPETDPELEPTALPLVAETPATADDDIAVEADSTGPVTAVPQTPAAVREALASPAAAQRRAAVLATSLLDVPEAIRLLSRIVRTDPDAEVRTTAAATLGSLLGIDEAVS